LGLEKKFPNDFLHLNYIYRNKIKSAKNFLKTITE
jgi:hypothetical protein